MASKQRRKQPRQPPPAPPPAEPRSSGGRWALIAVAVVAVAGAGAFFLLGGDRTGVAPGQAGEASSTPASSAATDGAAAGAEQTPAAPQFTSEDLEGLPMPPLPYVPQTAGPADLMRQAYVFAARNPDVLDYVPCYCGCGQTDGHRGNTDCFVESRAPNGAVTEWDVHGMT